MPAHVRAARAALFLVAFLACLVPPSSAHPSGRSILSNCVFEASASPRTSSSSGETHALLHAGVPGDVDLRLRWRIEMAGLVGNDTDVRWGDLRERHRRRLHVLFVHQDLDVVSHAHPEDFVQDPASLPDDATVFTLRDIVLPIPGRYAILATAYLAVPPDGPLAECDATGVAREFPPPGAEEETQLRASLDVRPPPAAGEREQERDDNRNTETETETETETTPSTTPSTSSSSSLRPPVAIPGTVSTSRASPFREGAGLSQRAPDATSLDASRRSCCAIAGPWVPAGEGACYDVTARLSGEEPTPSNPGTIVGAVSDDVRSRGDEPASSNRDAAPSGVWVAVVPSSSSDASANASANASRRFGVLDAATANDPPSACVGLVLSVKTRAYYPDALGRDRGDYPLVAYLGAAAHLAVASADASHVAHAHALPVPLRGASTSSLLKSASDACAAARSTPPGTAPGHGDGGRRHERTSLTSDDAVAAVEISAETPRGTFHKIFATFADERGATTTATWIYLANATDRDGAAAEARDAWAEAAEARDAWAEAAAANAKANAKANADADADADDADAPVPVASLTCDGVVPAAAVYPAETVVRAASTGRRPRAIRAAARGSAGWTLAGAFVFAAAAMVALGRANDATTTRGGERTLAGIAMGRLGGMAGLRQYRRAGED